MPSKRQQTHTAAGVASTREVLQQHRLCLSFQGISFWLRSSRSNITQRLRCILNNQKQQQAPQQCVRVGKQLLCGVSGVAHAGRLLAILGPSGAGKTTLLSVLAADSDTLAAGHMSGQVSLVGSSGSNATAAAAATLFRPAYVKQFEMLLPTITPREALIFAAALRLPSPAVSKAQRLAAVEQLLTGMRLQDCADTMVGDAAAGSLGLSGGERRRLAAAVQLLPHPYLVLMDEPTSGQDSSTAIQVVRFIKSLVLSRAEPGVLIMSLHQPGQDLTGLMDDLLLLAPGGLCCYHGPASAALTYFTQHVGRSLPPHTSLAEWYITLITRDSSIGTGEECTSIKAAAKSLPGAWTAFCSQQAAADDITGNVQQLCHLDCQCIADKAIAPCVEHICSASGMHTAAPLRDTEGAAIRQHEAQEIEGCASIASLSAQQASFYIQVWLIVCRSLKWWMRSPRMLQQGIAFYTLAGCYQGSLFWRLPAVGPDAAMDRLSALYMWLMNLVSWAPFRAIQRWSTESPVLRQELASGYYCLAAYVVGSKLLVCLTLELIPVIIASAASYWMFGLQATADKFWRFLALSCLDVVISTNLGNIVGMFLPDIDQAMPVATVLCMLALMFTGYAVQQLPPWFEWTQQVPLFTHLYAALVRNEFDGLSLTLPLSASTGAPGANLTQVTTSALRHIMMASANDTTAWGADLQTCTTEEARPSMILATMLALKAADGSNITTDALTFVPAAIQVHAFDTVDGFISCLLLYAAASTAAVIALTAMVVRTRQLPSRKAIPVVRNPFSA